MANNHLVIRTKKYFKLSSYLAQLDNAQLYSLFENCQSNQSSTGWGTNCIIVLRKSPVFVKRLPVTNLEYDNLFSTRNLYDLPTYCNYGFGSTGFGVFRELVTHLKTTHWVLEGAIATFPLMYHYRITPFSGQWMDVDKLQHQTYVEYWGNSKNAGNYMLDRAIASYELILFLEYIPYVLTTWLQDNPNRLEKSLDDLRITIDFLKTKKIIHFDTHFQNVLTDSEQIYLTDFGLALDQSFGLTKDEESFFEQNKFYDYGEILRNLGHLIQPVYNSCSENNKRRIREKYNIPEDLQPYELRAMLLDNIKQIHTDKDLKLNEFYVASIVKYRSIIALMQDFFVDMSANNNKDTKLDHAKLRLLLNETGFLSSAISHNR